MSYTGFCGSAPVLEQLPQGQWWQQCVGIASGFCLGASSRTFLEFSTPVLKHSSKKEEKRRIKEISIHIPLYIHVGILLFMMLCDISFLFVLLLSGYDDLPSH